jgi:hypothetical protein
MSSGSTICRVNECALARRALSINPREEIVDYATGGIAIPEGIGERRHPRIGDRVIEQVAGL